MMQFPLFTAEECFHVVLLMAYYAELNMFANRP